MPKKRTSQAEMMRAKGYLPVREVADAVGVHFTTVYKWIRRGDVGSMRVGRAKYVSAQSLISFLGPAGAQALELRVGREEAT